MKWRRGHKKQQYFKRSDQTQHTLTMCWTPHQTRLFNWNIELSGSGRADMMRAHLLKQSHHRKDTSPKKRDWQFLYRFFVLSKGGMSCLIKTKSRYLKISQVRLILASICWEDPMAPYCWISGHLILFVLTDYWRADPYTVWTEFD